MPISITCSVCNSTLKAPEAMIGRATKCPKCNNPILIQANKQENSSDQNKIAEIQTQGKLIKKVEGKPIDVIPQKVADVKECAFCGEEVLAVAKKCKHCGETLDVALRSAEEAKRLAENANKNSGSSAAASTTVVIQNTNLQSSPKAFPHLLHFIITIFTGGLWLPIWILLYVFRSR